ncbi:MAG TPA: KH domain-containing protein [Terriglobales bacterium]|nr:KH domain-containing protein [Terriglobales bacterium]
MTGPTGDAHALIVQVAKALVDTPDQVSVEAFDEDGETVFELTVAESDMGKVIGKSGRVARAMRTLLNAAAIKQNKRFALEILE